METPTAKQRALEALLALPDDATLGDAVERLCLLKAEEERRAAPRTPVFDEAMQRRFLSEISFVD